MLLALLQAESHAGLQQQKVQKIKIKKNPPEPSVGCYGGKWSVMDCGAEMRLASFIPPLEWQHNSHHQRWRALIFLSLTLGWMLCSALQRRWLADGFVLLRYITSHIHVARLRVENGNQRLGSNWLRPKGGASEQQGKQCWWLSTASSSLMSLLFELLYKVMDYFEVVRLLCQPFLFHYWWINNYSGEKNMLWMNFKVNLNNVQTAQFTFLTHVQHWSLLRIP